MFVTIGTEFSQFQSARRIMSILLSNISKNACWFLINIVLNTTDTFQNNLYTGIFTLGHEPPFGFLFTPTLLYFHLPSEVKKKGTKKIEIAYSKSNYEKFRYVTTNSNYSNIIKYKIISNTFKLYLKIRITVQYFS